MRNILVSVVIVNYNGRQFLKTAIDSLLKSTFRNFEIIVVDNASTDGSKEFLKQKYPNVKLVENKSNLGYSGINSAITHCQGKYLLFLNNDVKIEKSSIGNLVKAIDSDSSTGMTAPKLVNFYDKKLVSGGTWLSRAFYNGHIKGNSKPRELIIPYLGVGLIRTSIAKKFGYLFDPDYFIYGEDVDLGLRLRLLNQKVVFVHNAILYHMHSATMKNKSNAYSTYLMERNLLMTFLKILSGKNILLLLPYVLFVRILAIIKDIISLKFDVAASRLKAMFFVLTKFKLIREKRAQIQKLRKASDSYIFEVFSERYLFRPKFNV